MTHMQAAMRLLKFLMDAPQVAAAIRSKKRAGLLRFLTVAETSAKDPADSFVPWQLDESFRIRNAHQLGSLGPIADVITMAVHEQVGHRSVDQLKTVLSHLFPVVRRNTF